MDKCPNLIAYPQVYVRTPYGGRYIDFLVWNIKTGKIVAREIKSGNATRTKQQVLADNWIVRSFGKNEFRVPTKVIRFRTMNFKKWANSPAIKPEKHYATSRIYARMAVEI